MKNNKVLAVALSAGLVFSGAYLANSNINVAYASESQPTIEELKAQITQLKNEKNEIDRKKAQSKNAINWREDNRKVSELPEEKLKKYEIWDQKDRKVIEECDAQMLELDKKIAAIQEQIKALENSPTPGEENPGNGSTEADKAKEFEDYKKKYSDKIDGLSDLTEAEKAAAKEEIANATSEAEVNKAYNKAYSANQDAEYDREKKEREENFAKDKENAKKEIDDYGDKLTEKEKESFKEQIDKAPTKGAITGILEEAKKASENPQEPENPQDPETPTIDEDYKDMFLENLLSLSKLTDEEKEAFKERIEKAKTNGEIYDIYNQAIDLNNSRDKKPEDSSVNKDYKDMFLNNLLTLSKLSYAEKESFKERMDKAKTNAEIYDIYNEAVALNTSRKQKPTKENESENPINPAKPPHSKDESEDSSSDLIYVAKGYKYVSEGFYHRLDLEDSYYKLKLALNENEIYAQAIRILLKYTPNTVKDVRGQLESLLKESVDLQEQAKLVLKEYESILGY